jgi:hypothetical protein
LFALKGTNSIHSYDTHLSHTQQWEEGKGRKRERGRGRERKRKRETERGRICEVRAGEERRLPGSKNKRMRKNEKRPEN